MKTKYVLKTNKPIEETISTENMWEISNPTNTSYFIYAESRDEAIQIAIGNGIKRSIIKECFLSYYTKCFRVYYNALIKTQSIYTALGVANSKGYNALCDCQDAWNEAIDEARYNGFIEN